MQVTQEDITYVARLVDELCGVVLDDSKAYLVESRLNQLARETSCASYSALCQQARYNGDRTLQQRIIDAITTQETLFFRDESPFQALQNKVLPDLIDGRERSGLPKRLRFWSAACSTGQEPYSLAMVLCETMPDVSRWDVSIMATDIAEAAIQKASRGWYTSHEIERGMKPAMLSKYFVAKQGGWQVKDELRAMVAFQRRNLLEPFDELGTYDLIFCRNVAIYFDGARRNALFHRLADRLSRDGCLFVGSAESLLDLGPRFAPQSHCRATYYQPNKVPCRTG